jgi:branched-chain amino acid transport system substrate-binding protein
VHALFEVALDTLKRAKDVGKREAIRDALAATSLNTIVGRIAWGKGPVKNVTKTPLVGGQWVRGKKHKYELIVVDNRTAPGIPAAGKLKPIA